MSSEDVEGALNKPAATGFPLLAVDEELDLGNQE